MEKRYIIKLFYIVLDFVEPVVEKGKSIIFMVKKSITKHHLYLRNNAKLIYIDTIKHTLFHFKVYEYVLEKYGKKEIDKYLRWFKKKYNLKCYKEKK